MVNQSLSLSEYKHPSVQAEQEFSGLIGIDDQKESLLLTLSIFLDRSKAEKWYKKHHKNSPLPLYKQIENGTPLIIFSGEVGCGKTALAQTIATPLAKTLDKHITVFESPSNIRGGGMVGELSNRITEMFNSAKSTLGKGKHGILIIDEADDIATSRSQNQAHHEDRAGLNVLIKQLDLISREECSLAVILITNRVVVLDPAIRRRTALHLTFERPQGEKLKKVFEHIFMGVKLSPEDLDALQKITESRKIRYSFSDLIQRAGKQAIYQAIDKNVPFSVELYTEVLKSIEPSPEIEETSISKMNNNG